MPWAIHSFEMTTEVSCSYGKLRGTKLGGLMSGFPHLFLLCISLPAKVASTCATLCILRMRSPLCCANVNTTHCKVYIPT